MSRAQVDFQRRVAQALGDDFLRDAVALGTRNQAAARAAALEQLGDWQHWRERAREIRARAIANLDHYLDQITRNVTARGGQVHRARTADQARRIIAGILDDAGARRIVKSKSMVSEEIELNRFLEEQGCTVVETDLGEYILQLAGEPPSHIVAPALHKTKEEVRQLLSRVAGRELPGDAQALTDYARQHLRQQFLRAEAGITGANFVVAESGHVVIVTNEGNGRLVSALPPVHIVVIGMERVVPTWADLPVLLELLPRSATGQKLTVYTNVVGGVRQPGELDGPREFHLVIVDNGRSGLLGTRFEEVLYCIRCAACQNACPVYRQIGGLAYGSVYAGPIGAVLTPLLDGYDRWDYMPYASSLCAACDEVCPVLIPLHELLIDLRHEGVQQQENDPGEAMAFQVFRWACTHPWAYRAAARVGSWLQKPWLQNGWLKGGPGPLQAWTSSRDFPAVAARPFRDRWAQLSREEAAGGASGVKPAPVKAAAAATAKPAGGDEGPQAFQPQDFPPRADHPGTDPEALRQRFMAELESVGGTSATARWSAAGRQVVDFARAKGIKDVVAWDPGALDGDEAAMLATVGQALEDAGINVTWWRGEEPALRRAAAGAQLGIVVAGFAIAASGTVGLPSGPGRGRSVSLLPESLLVLVPGDVIVPTLADVLPAWGGPGTDPLALPQNIAMVTGPSKSADIGFELIHGVHGPKEVHALVVTGDGDG